MMPIQQEHEITIAKATPQETNDIDKSLWLVKQYFDVAVVDFFCNNKRFSRRISSRAGGIDLDRELRLFRSLFKDNSLHVIENANESQFVDSRVLGNLHFYAQYPVFGRFNELIGVLSIGDPNPRTLSKIHRNQLMGFAAMLSHHINVGEAEPQSSSDEMPKRINIPLIGLTNLTQAFSQKLVAAAVSLLIGWAIATSVFNSDKAEHISALQRQDVTMKSALFESLERLDRQGEVLSTSSLLLQGYLSAESTLTDAGLGQIMAIQYSRTRFLKGYAVFNTRYEKLAVWAKPSFDMQAYGLSNWLRQSSVAVSKNLSVKMVADTAFIFTSVDVPNKERYFIVKALNLTGLLSTITSQMNTPGYQVYLDTPGLLLSQNGAVQKRKPVNGISAASNVFPSSWKVLVVPSTPVIPTALPQLLLIKNIAIFIAVIGFVYYFLRLPRRLHHNIRQAHQTILSREELYTDALDALPNAFAVFNASGSPLLSNQAFIHLFDCGEEYVASGTTFDALVADAQRRGVITHFEESEDVKNNGDKVIEIGLQDGRWLSVLKRQMQDKAVVYYFHDITENYHREKKLSELSQQVQSEALIKEKFVSQFNDQIKAPLLMLHELVEHLQNSHDALKSDMCLMQLREVNHQIRCVTEQLAGIGKAQSQKLKLKLSDFDVNNVIDRGIDILSTKAQNSTIELGAETEGDLTVNTDEKLLSQVHLYLLSNLLEVVRGGRLITEARIRNKNDSHTLEIIYKIYGNIKPTDFYNNVMRMSADTFDEESLSQASLEVRYFRSMLHALSIKNILLREKSGFTRIVVSVPFSRPYIDQSTESAISIIQSTEGRGVNDEKRLSILLVDDDPINEVITRSMLEAEGYEIQCAATAVEALLMASQKEFDVILMDIMLPDISGVQVMRKIRRSNTNIDTKIIAYTANEDTDQQYEKLGFDDYISKPVDKVKLREKLAR